MSLYVIPSLVALVLKLWILSHSRFSLVRSNPALTGFLLGLLGMNAVEFYYYFLGDSPRQYHVITLLFYFSALTTVTGFTGVAIGRVLPSGMIRFVGYPLLVLFVVIATILLSSDIFITGGKKTSYAVTRIPGEYYWVLKSFLMAGMLSGCALLIYGALKHKDTDTRRFSKVVVLSMSPVVLTGIAALLVIDTAYQFNVFLVMSLMTTITLACLIYIENRYNLFKFLTYVPFSTERRLKTRISRLGDEFMLKVFTPDDGSGKVNLKELTSQFESAVIAMALEATNGDKTQAADLLNVGRATLHRKINKAS